MPETRRPTRYWLPTNFLAGCIGGYRFKPGILSQTRLYIWGQQTGKYVQIAGQSRCKQRQFHPDPAPERRGVQSARVWITRWRNVSMGQEANCEVRFGSKVSTGTALLETDDLIFRGDFRLSIPLKSIQSLEAADGVLRGTVSF